LPNPLGKQVVRAAHAWFDIYMRVPVAAVVPALGLLGPLATALLARFNRPSLAFVTSALSIVGIIGSAGLSLFPFIMPSSIKPDSSLTIWDAVSSQMTLAIMFWAVAVFLPLVLGYTIWCYAHMWGRVTAQQIETGSHSAY
jgi:cytochrome d ubiquinol oxidase subunit II